jgi:hypothetical protein
MPPPFTQAPSPSDNSAWISTANPSKGDFMPASCGGTGGVLNVGDQIGIQNGQTPNLKPISDCFQSGVTQYTVPVVSCAEATSQWNHPTTVVGFATVTVTQVNSQGSPKFISFSTIINNQLSGPVGGRPFGNGTVRLLV